MTRMRDETSDDPAVQAGIELLRRASPTPAMPEMKRRVWAALAAHDARPAPLNRPLRLPVVAAAALILLVAGTAGAMIARRFIAPAFRRAAATAAPSSVVEAPAARVRRKAPAAALPAPAPAPAGVPLAEPAPVEVERAAPASRSPGRVRHQAASLPERTAPRPVESALAAPSPRERAEVLDAMIALRRDHDAERAGALLDRYLATRPHGALREEALALAIEAADARGDRAGVSTWARTYTSDYPTGRFVGFARSHLTVP